MTGVKSGRLVVLRQGEPRKGGGSNWICRCICGNEFVTIGANIRKGSTRSCGCLAREWAQKAPLNPKFIEARETAKRTHGAKSGGTMTPTYRVWLGIKSRCTRPKHKDYKNWGGRGITVCPEWNSSFETFLRDMGERPSPAHSIDRLETDDGYRPGNCRWATTLEQGEHRRTNRAVTVDGQAFHSVTAACRHFGVAQSVANMRIQAGIDPAVAVSFKGRLPARRTRESYLPADRRP